LSHAEDGDIIAIIGKGHEDYQEIEGVRYHFLDREVVQETVKKLKGAGHTVVLATNPVFPMNTQKRRLHWAGADESDFALITSYENSRACKPNVRYYEEILQKLGASASDCIMVGNDVTEDMVAEKLGIKVFLLTDCLINRENKDISVYPHGGFGQLGEFLEKETGRI